MPQSLSHSRRSRTRRFLDTALHFIFPPVCASCQSVGSMFCDSCLQAVVRLRPPLCQQCGRPLDKQPGLCPSCRRHPLSLFELRAVALHKATLVQPIHQFKYEGMFALAEPLAALMVHNWPTWATEPDLVVPVPLHPERERERGYNQSFLLARILCAELDLACEPAVLQRIRYTRPQVGLNHQERRENVTDAFQAWGQSVVGKQVLLVDDVCTTGATLSAAAEALLEAGASRVSAYCLARAVNR